MPDKFAIIGKPLPKVDAMGKVTGETAYADDLVLPRMLHCKMLRSPTPHARIVHIDTSKAEAMPGVHAVISGADVPVKFGILPVSQDEEALALDKVHQAINAYESRLIVPTEDECDELMIIRQRWEDA